MVKEAARQALQAAEKSRSIPELEKVIQQSQDAGLSPTDRNAADKVLREEKLKHALAAALKSRSIPDLEKAIQAQRSIRTRSRNSRLQFSRFV